ncbi:MAG: N-(5-phosphoribosyl)anthranilate isomerase [Candidatus Midichloriaceae bacterium]|jgi:phosphoribosylanthranilate isomerase|nr:N-(5-phosphoribosyl)anthranilate isomerase [Candidatus Midichloriaceae bacterium]
MSIRIKISGITTLEALNVCIKHSVSYIGAVFYNNSPRNMSFNHAYEFAQIIPSNIKKVAVVVKPDKNLIKEIQNSFNPDYYQLDDNEPFEQAEYLSSKYHLKLIKTVYVGSSLDGKLVQNFEPYVEGFLFEAQANNSFYIHQPENTFDWGLVKNAPTNKFKILSGGINKFNVFDAIRESGINVINASSTLESSPGIKDVEVLEDFLRLTKIEFN